MPAEPKRTASPSPRRTESPSPRASPGPKRPAPAGARGEDGPSPGPKPRSSTKRPPTAKPSKSKAAEDGGSPGPSGTPAAATSAEEDLDHIRVYMRIAAAAGPQTSTCLGHDARSAWSLDFEGQRSGPTVLLDAVFGVDQSEAALYPEVIDHLVADFVRAPRGVVRRPGRPDPPSGRSPRGPASLPPHHAPPHEPRAA